MKYKLIYVEWADTISPVEKRWYQDTEAIDWADNEDYWVCETGFLIKETKEWILLSAKYNVTARGKDNEYISHSDLVKIPKGWIRNRKTLKI